MRPSPVPLRCDVVVAGLDAWTDGTLAPLARARPTRHLARCRGCGTYARGYLATVRLARAAGAADPIPEALVQRFLSATA